MFKNIKKKMKDQRGLTLVELLAVIVILGIISAIAVPSIGGLIDNTKKDAHLANAQQMINSAKLAVTTNTTLQDSNTYFLTLEYLEDKKFMDFVKDPDKTNNGYTRGTNVEPLKQTANPTGSWIKIVKGKVAEVNLVNSERGIQGVAEENLTRESVTAVAKASGN
ncbi:type II secretion system protein [Neobacillus sp. SCS-31]|uniref:type II secretion system protein n=1 Tax=Neobacillus oceani TaxID=3115292 RepID=UPI003905F80E